MLCGWHPDYSKLRATVAAFPSFGTLALVSSVGSRLTFLGVQTTVSEGSNDASKLSSLCAYSTSYPQSWSLSHGSVYLCLSGVAGTTRLLLGFAKQEGIS